MLSVELDCVKENSDCVHEHLHRRTASGTLARGFLAAVHMVDENFEAKGTKELDWTKNVALFRSGLALACVTDTVPEMPKDWNFVGALNRLP